MAFGAAIYFTLPFEPHTAARVLIAGLSMAIVIFRKPKIILTTVLLFIFGFCYANGFTKLIDTPQIKHTLRNHEITGTVSNIDHMNNKTRVFLKLTPVHKNATVRVSLGEDMDIPEIGDVITARVTLFKPDGPAAPGTFDYARWAYFNKLSATGYVNEITSRTPGNVISINKLRDYIHVKTNSFLSDTLVLGYKNAISPDDGPIWTATGIGHVWSISGFHMTLVGGWLFAFFYLIFRSIPPITRNIPARFPAIICAWIGLLFYLFLSGIDVATVRAFLMTSLMFIAFLFGRTAFSLRNVCLAFIAIFLINPHYIMQPGFQLSFSAIFGMIWFFGGRGEYKKLSFSQKTGRAIRVATQTSIIATIFTSAFVAYHFYSIPVYGLIGNLILLPVFSFAVMPLVMIGTITALFGWTGPLIWADKFYDWTFIAAGWIADLPFATIQTPHISGFALSLITIGFLCLMFIKNHRFKYTNYILCGVFICGGIINIISAPRPVLYATADHELVAFKNENGKLEFNKKKSSNHYFAPGSWKQLNFEDPNTENARRKCERGVCVYKTDNWTLAYMQRYIPLSRNIVEFCRDDSIDFIVSYFRVDAPKCNHKILRGGFVIYESGRVKYTPAGRYWNGT